VPSGMDMPAREIEEDASRIQVASKAKTRGDRFIVPQSELSLPLTRALRWIVICDVTQRRRVAILLILLTTAVGVTFIPVLRHGFVNWDDQAQLYQNPDFNPPALTKVLRYWREPHMQLYLPLTYSVWGAIAAVAYEPDAQGGVHLDARWFHAANVASHLVAVLICFALLRRLSGDDLAAAIGAGLMAVHPLVVEPVAWASALYTLLSTALGLAALWQYVVYAQRDAPGQRTRAGPLVMATVLFVLALLAKPSAVVIPLMAGAIDLLLIRRSLRRAAPVVLCWLLLAVPIAVVARNAQPAKLVPDIPLHWRPIVALDAIGFYLWKLFVPLKLAADYGRAPDLLVARRLVLPALVTVLVLIGALLWMRRKRWVAAGIGLFVIGLLPYLGLTKFDFQWFSTVADRYVYLAMLGPALVLAMMVRNWPRREVVAGCCLVLAVLAGLSFAQARVWRDTTTLLEHTLAVNSRSLVAHRTLAYLDVMNGRNEQAELHYIEALKTRPYDPPTHFNYANLLASEGRVPEGIAHYEAALDVAHEDVLAMNNLAVAYIAAGRLEDARGMLKRAIELRPDYADGHANLGKVLMSLGDREGARAAFEHALKINPNHAVARSGMQRL
jgi:tetratricopeptide (TPR) repeat protein